ncbi:hypothetical protein F4780DRAFT_774193 [Xylariomycetidae sp. FL0641]|nr:hypothetical protein F4780DRAFT_774193 [Xylariomycetidae sp. FL0641]
MGLPQFLADTHPVPDQNTSTDPSSDGIYPHVICMVRITLATLYDLAHKTGTALRDLVVLWCKTIFSLTLIWTSLPFLFAGILFLHGLVLIRKAIGEIFPVLTNLLETASNLVQRCLLLPQDPPDNTDQRVQELKPACFEHEELKEESEDIEVPSLIGSSPRGCCPPDSPPMDLPRTFVADIRQVLCVPALDRPLTSKTESKTESKSESKTESSSSDEEGVSPSAPETEPLKRSQPEDVPPTYPMKPVEWSLLSSPVNHLEPLL